jgi:hypothetical protein
VDESQKGHSELVVLRRGHPASNRLPSETPAADEIDGLMDFVPPDCQPTKAVGVAKVRLVAVRGPLPTTFHRDENGPTVSLTAFDWNAFNRFKRGSSFPRASAGDFGYAWSMKHFPKKELAYAVAFVALLGGLYVGSYYSMVEQSFSFAPTVVNGGFKLHFVPKYRFGGHTAKAIFAPWHQVDLRIRPEYWQLTGTLEWFERD